MTADAVLADWDAAFNSAACETAADLFPPDAVYVDHLPLGWPPGPTAAGRSRLKFSRS